MLQKTSLRAEVSLSPLSQDCSSHSTLCRCSVVRNSNTDVCALHSHLPAAL